LELRAAENWLVQNGLKLRLEVCAVIGDNLRQRVAMAALQNIRAPRPSCMIPRRRCAPTARQGCADSPR
jgi:hypothetical protein